MAKKTTTTECVELTTEEITINTSTMHVRAVGIRPFIANRMANKGLRELLFPKKKLTKAEKETHLKHDPVQEYRDSPYVLKDDRAATFLAHLPSAFKGAIKCVATDMPGAIKAQIGRLVSVEGNVGPGLSSGSEFIQMYGVPKMSMSVVRGADTNHTPDVRTRAILPEWCCEFDITVVKPLISERKVLALLGSAGVIQGTGDWRPGKGNGTFGRFRLCNQNDAEFLRIKSEGGRVAQRAALLAERPECYDDMTEELFSWFIDELVRRDRVPDAKELTAEGQSIGMDESDEDEWGGASVIDGED